MSGEPSSFVRVFTVDKTSERGTSMGLSCGSAELIIQEHLYRPLYGEVLLIGRQNTDITPRAMTNLLRLYGLKPRVPYVIERPGRLNT